MAKSDSGKLGIMPRGDRVVVEPMGKEDKTASGIIIPDTVKGEKPERGTVVAVGPGRYEDGKLVPMDLKAGDKVLFESTYRDPIKLDGKEYYIFNEANILAIIK